MRNVEVKIRVHDKEALLKNINNLVEGQEPTVLRQCDNFYETHSPWRKKLRHIEGTDDYTIISYLRENAHGPRLSEYEKSTFSKGPELSAAMKDFGETIGAVRKIRHLFMYGQTRIHVDEVEGLGTFMELEVVLNESQNTAEGENIAKNIMQKLSIDSADEVTCSYFDLLYPK